MKRTALLTVVVAFAIVLILAADARAIYHPTLGHFLQRDPGGGGPKRLEAWGPVVGRRFVPRDPTGQYTDGMHLYQYATSNPVERLDPYGLDDAGADEVRLHVVLDHIHGTTEARQGGTKRWHAVGASWEEGWGGWLVHLAGRVTWKADSSIEVDEEASGTSWEATLQIINRLPQSWIDEGWWLQTSVDYWWTASIENVCCKTEKVSVTASGWGVDLSPGQGTFYSVPDSTIHDVAKGSSKKVGRAYLGAALRQKRALLLLVRGEVQISIKCVP